MTMTKHASIRAQQRAIPPLVDRWLDEFGEDAHEGNGKVRVYFSRRSKRRMARELGARPVALFSHYLNAYRLEGEGGVTITMAWQTCHIRRK